MAVTLFDNQHMKSQKDILKEITDNLSRKDLKSVYAADLYGRLGKEKDELMKNVIQEKISSIQLNDEIKAIVTVEEVRSATEKLGYGIAFNQDQTVYLYNKEYWESVSELDLMHFFGNALQKMGVDKYTSKNVKVVSRIYEQARYSLYQPMQQESEHTRINLKNLTLSIDDKGNVTEENHKPEDYFFYVLPYEYDPNAQYPMFQKFLDEVLPEKDVQAVLQEFVGSCLCNSIKLEKVLCCVGSGFNGKSVFFETVMSLLGNDNVCTYNINSLCNENGYTRAMIKNKLLNYSSDFNGKIFSNGIFKQLASGEPTESRRPYKDPEIIRNYARLAFNCNSLPASGDTSYGFRRRLLIVPFKQKIDPKKADPELSRKLRTELPGILLWAVEGLKRLVTNGKKLSKSPAIEAMEQEYKETTDSVAMYLENYHYYPDPQKEQGITSLYNEYKQYCEKNRLIVETRANFKMKLQGEGYTVKEMGKKGVKIGISSPDQASDIQVPVPFHCPDMNVPSFPPPERE